MAIKAFRVSHSVHVGLPIMNRKTGKKERPVFKKGAIVESEDDLAAKFPNKFELVTVAAPVATARAKPEKMPVPDPVEEEDLAEEIEEDEEELDEGEDVTDNFKAAKDAGLTVQKLGDNYVVLRGDKTLDDDLETAAAVRQFVKAWVKKNKTK